MDSHTHHKEHITIIWSVGDLAIVATDTISFSVERPPRLPSYLGTCRRGGHLRGLRETLNPADCFAVMS